jgi:hypothetical protein
MRLSRLDEALARGQVALARREIATLRFEQDGAGAA